MPEEQDRRNNVLGLLIVLLALTLVAVGIIGLLSYNSRGAPSQRSLIPLPATPLPVAAESPPSAPGTAAANEQSYVSQTAGPQSAVVRGGSRAKATPKAAEAAPPTLQLEVLSARYDVSGNPTQGCAGFDNRVPMRRLTLQLVVVNRSGADVQNDAWGAVAYVGTSPATLCFEQAGAQLPSFADGTRQPVTWVAFVAPDQSLTSLEFTAASGLRARVCFDEERTIVCLAP